MLHPPFAPRRAVGLAPRWKSLRLDIDEFGKPDTGTARPGKISIKVSPGEDRMNALSSGASSALVRSPEGAIVRLKRCGFATKGIGGRSGYVGRVGLMSLAEALQEAAMLSALRRQGLCAACRPIAIDILADPEAPIFSEHAWASLSIAITSDVRADEYFMRIITADLIKAGLPRPFIEIEGDEKIMLTNWQQAAAALAAGRAAERIAKLGKALGGFLRAAHDAGIMRGRGSVWMGNDVIGADGRLSAVDCDGGTREAEGSWTMMKRVEAAEYAAGFADCFSWGQETWLAELATIMTEMFWEGYRSAAESKTEALEL